MQINNSIRYALIFQIAALLLGGCSRKPKPATLTTETVEQQLLASIDQTFTEAHTMLQNGQTNTALARITAVYNDPRYKKFRDITFEGIVQFLVNTKQPEEAKRLIAKACLQEPANVTRAIDILHNYLTNHGGHPAIAVWAADLAATTPALPLKIKHRLIDWRLSAALAQQDDENVTALLTQAFRDLAPSDSLTLAVRVLESHLSGDRLDAADRVLAQLASIQPKTTELTELTTMMHIQIMAGRRDWDTLATAFTSASGTLSDQKLHELMLRIIVLVRKSGRYDVADGLCEEIIFKQPAKALALSFATRSWAENAMTTNRVALPMRLNTMLEAKVPPREVGMIYQRYYYDLINEPALLKAMCDVGNKLLPLLNDIDLLKSIKTMILDGAFIREDYDMAIQRLEDGIPGRDEAWHKMALIKVKAHRALKNNQPRQAVQFFREFMVCVQTVKDEDTSDPSTNIQHTKEMIIARNAKRIAEILTAIPDPEAAKKAYAEAHDWYRQALEKANSETRRIIESEMAQLPKQ